MTASIRRSAAAMLLAFIAVSAGLVYWQVVRSPALDSAPSNPRVAAASQTEQRGSILAANGQVLARSVEDPDGHFRREYSDPSLAQTIGYVSTRYGLDGLEATYNDYLSGQQGDDPLSAVWADITREPRPGNDLVLTIDPTLQKIAAQALGNRPGAVVALDPSSGAVKAMVSAPTYDPNKLDELGASLLNASNQPLLNRATQGLYPPGSTYKTVTATAALDSGIVKPDDVYQCSGDGIVINGFRIACTNAPPGQTQWTFENAYAYSINATFAQVALQIGASRFTEYSQRFGVGQAIPFDIDLAESRVFQPGSRLSDILLASSGFGQGQLSVTPLQMALIAATVANGGVEPSPYLVAQIRDPDGDLIEDRHPAPRGEVMRPETAATMRQFMQASVRLGWGQEAGLEGLDVAGKSGTAETGVDGKSHAWVIGYAPASTPKLAVAVIVENGGAGGIAAGQVAAQLFKAVLGH
jgi:peptidoglycan glycosyltransferase